MPFISETASAIKSRFGFHDHSSDSVPSVRSSLDLKPLLFENPGQSVVATPPVRDIKWEDGEDGSISTSSQSFELREDPSFWKDHNVQVIIRIRPLSNSEISLYGHGKCVKQESCQTLTWIGHPESRFTFDLVADENVSQENLFKVAGVPMVENCVGGYNSCMFAYGQTGSGKTHTMLGDIEGGTRRHSVNCGMTPRVFEYLFSRIQKEKEARRDEKLRFSCKCSFLEIYNEQILDLLDPSSNNLQIREDTKKGVHVENLKEIEVTNARDVIQQLIQGSANRKVAATNMNRASSRSHSVFTCIIESKWESQGVTHHRFARLNLVDLAGSERQKSSGAEGDRLKEATNINKSLSTLGLVIMNLVSLSNGKSLHVPYRDSKLTFLLQDSLGGNSKTIIIANITPANCCSLETLSTLKFAQRAKFIKNNAIVNEDASGDVITMRIQIQQLKKEVARLRCLVNGGAENQDCDGLTVSFPGSPGSFKWEGLQGSFSPLTQGKRMSQNKDYEIALVGAFKREKDKDMVLQALSAENQAAMKLAKQREDEIRGLKMRLRLRESGIKRLEAVCSGKISAEAHLLKEKEDLLAEISVLRTQSDRNLEVTRFAMENLRLKEEIRRLKSFCAEGEQDIMNEQIMVLQNKLLEALDWKLMHESDPSSFQKVNSDAMDFNADSSLLSSNQEPGLSSFSSVNEENEFLRMQVIQSKAEMDSVLKKLDFCLEEKEKLERHTSDLLSKLEEQKSAMATEEGTKETGLVSLSLSKDVPLVSFDDQMDLATMVDAIAAVSQREAEAHERVFVLSKENEELRMKIMVLLEDNNRLIELYEQATSESTCMNKAECVQDGNKVQEYSEPPEVEQIYMKKVNENLEHQLMEMHEENEKLMGLYENAMKERDELKRMLSCCEQNRTGSTREVDEPSIYVESKDVMVDTNEADLSGLNKQVSLCSPCMDGDFLMGENFKHVESALYGDQVDAGEHIDLGALSDMETEPSNITAVRVSEDLDLVKKKLDRAQEKLLDSTLTVKMFSSLENAIIEADKLSKEIELLDNGIQLKEQEFKSFAVLSSEMQKRITLSKNNLSALKYSLSNFSSSIIYFEQREDRARERVDASMSYLDKKRQELTHHQTCKDETEVAQKKAQQSEVELRNNLVFLNSKLEEENRRQDNEKVLLALDNVTNIEPQQKNWHLGCKASQLLKSEEEKTRLQSEIKLCREKLSVTKREFEVLTRRVYKMESEMQSTEMDVQKGLRTVEEMKTALKNVIQEKEMLIELRDNGKSEIESVVLLYQQHLFELALKQAEMEELEAELQMDRLRKEELQIERAVATEKIIQMLEEKRSNSTCSFFCEKMEEELQSVSACVLEVKSILEGEMNDSCNC